MEATNADMEGRDEGRITPMVVSDVVPATHQGKIAVMLKSSPARPTFHSPVSTPQFNTERKRPHKGPENTPVPAGVSEALGRMDEQQSETPPRKRGRPKGWKPGMSYRELRGEPPPESSKTKERKTMAKSGSGTPVEGEVKPKKRGRPVKLSNMSARDLYLKSNPSYIPFCCEWQQPAPYGRCPAELQNMETLRKHVSLVHGTPDPIACWWGKCAEQEAHTEFVDEEDFLHHLEEAHLKPYEWHMGDGFQNQECGTLEQDATKLPSYLFDKDGNQVTPSIQDQELENTAGMLARRRQLRNIRRLAEENAPTEQDYLMQTLLGVDSKPHF
jgi:hypothetical protein